MKIVDDLIRGLPAVIDRPLWRSHITVVIPMVYINYVNLPTYSHLWPPPYASHNKKQPLTVRIAPAKGCFDMLEVW